MKIAMLSSEIAPFAKTGGLADVLGTLSVALEKRGHEISLIMPAYRCVLNGPFALDETGMQLAVPLGTVSGRGFPSRGSVGAKRVRISGTRRPLF